MLKIQKMDFLISVYIFCIMVSELMGGKTFPVAKIFDYQLNASVAVLVLPLIFTINDVITEVFGKERAQSLIRCGLVTVFFVLIFSVIATSLPPSTRFLKTEASYDMIFQTSTRIAASSLTAFALAEFLDVYVFLRIKKMLGKSKLWLRNNLSNFLSQFV